MIVSFKDQATEDIFKGCPKSLPTKLWRITSRKLDQLDSVQLLEELKVPPGNRLEKLSGNRKTEYSIRINEQYRICFIWGESGPINVEVTDYH
jgi:proteic killer suppression protein